MQTRSHASSSWIQPLDFERRGLRNNLIETCTIMGKSFPEFESWLAAEKTEKQEHWKRLDAMGDDPKGLLLYALEKLAEKKTGISRQATPHGAALPRPSLLSGPERKQKVGRNEPCPCGSGRMFKHCCIRK